MDESEVIEQVRQATRALNEALKLAHEAGMETSVDVLPVQKMGERIPRNMVTVRCTKTVYEIDETVG